MKTSVTLARDLGVTHRQLHYWMTQGYTPPSHLRVPDGEPEPLPVVPFTEGRKPQRHGAGSGHRLMFDAHAEETARTFAALLAAGFDHDTANYIRRRTDGETPPDPARDAALDNAAELILRILTTGVFA